MNKKSEDVIIEQDIKEINDNIENIEQDIKAIYKGFNMLYEYLKIEECHQEEKYYLRKIGEKK